MAIISKAVTAGQTLPDHTIAFTHRDRLGSVITLTDHNNNLMEHRSYDPFGKPRKGDFVDIAPATLSAVVGGAPYTSRGFTDHEHLDDAQLIHMNGRAYDYNLGRFLSVDPFIQAVGNSQSMNPYSYIMNNPLSGTDPSGYEVVWDRSKCTLSKSGCDAAVSAVLKTLGFEVNNGMVNLNHPNAIKGKEADKLMSELNSAKRGKNRARNRLARMGISVSGGTEAVRDELSRQGGSATITRAVVDPEVTSSVLEGLEDDNETWKANNETSSTQYALNLLNLMDGYDAIAMRDISEARNAFSKGRLIHDKMLRDMDSSQKEAMFWVAVGSSPGLVALAPEAALAYTYTKGAAAANATLQAGRTGTAWAARNKKDIARVCMLSVALCSSLKRDVPKLKDVLRMNNQRLEKIQNKSGELQRLNDSLRNVPTKVKK